jgi:hypothetical protein
MKALVLVFVNHWARTFECPAHLPSFTDLLPFLTDFFLTVFFVFYSPRTSLPSNHLTVCPLLIFYPSFSSTFRLLTFIRLLPCRSRFVYRLYCLESRSSIGLLSWESYLIKMLERAYWVLLSLFRLFLLSLLVDIILSWRKEFAFYSLLLSFIVDDCSFVLYHFCQSFSTLIVCIINFSCFNVWRS